MPDQLTKQEVDTKTDPSVAKQYDNESSSEQKFTVRIHCLNIL